MGMSREVAMAAPVAALIAGAALLASGSAGAQGNPGQAGFSANCAACHQEDGKGVEGAFPALAGSAVLTGPEEQPIGIVLHGRNAMPNLGADLSDEQIAQILTYARSAWGNAAPPIDKATVARVRGKPAA